MDDVTDLPARALVTPIRRPVHFINSVQTITPARPEASALPFPRGSECCKILLHCKDAGGK
jgi:hypothetical protein